MSDRFEVLSFDGTPLAVWVAGSGPPLVMVHGAISDHSNDAPFADVLERAVTTYATDRRGRGESGDALDYAIERELQDMAVVDAVASQSGELVAVWEHSYGADAAMGAATLSKNIAKLILYEPRFGDDLPTGVCRSVRGRPGRRRSRCRCPRLLSAGRGSERGGDGIHPLVVYLAGTSLPRPVPRELAAESSWIYHSDQFQEITAETLVLAGSESPRASQSEPRRRFRQLKCRDSGARQTLRHCPSHQSGNSFGDRPVIHHQLCIGDADQATTSQSGDHESDREHREVNRSASAPWRRRVVDQAKAPSASSEASS